MRVLFLGDIVGKVGRKAVRAALPKLVETHQPDFVIANAENAAGGTGCTPQVAEELLGLGIDALTLGNHAFQKREISPYLEAHENVLRPANFPPGTPGPEFAVLSKPSRHKPQSALRLGLVNLCGRVFMADFDDPFRTADRILEELGGVPILFDFHAEATSEKAAFAWYVDGRACAVIGTHTHVQTADERILPGGTAFISDAGMCGPYNSVIGVEKDIILRRFLTLMPEKFEVAAGPGVICGVVVDVQDETGNATRIERVFWTDVE